MTFVLVASASRLKGREVGKADGLDRLPLCLSVENVIVEGSRE